jgi:hypothetical protein
MRVWMRGKKGYLKGRVKEKATSNRRIHARWNRAASTGQTNARKMRLDKSGSPRGEHAGKPGYVNLSIVQGQDVVVPIVLVVGMYFS